MRMEAAMGVVNRRPVNLSLPRELLTKARGLTRNLSGTIEALLEGYVRSEEAKRRDEDERLDQVIDAMNAFHATHGLLSDELSQL